MGYDMEEGTVVRWLKSEGDEVNIGDAVAEIETDKAVVEFESTAEGVLRQILVSEGDATAVGRPIAIVGAADEEIPDAVQQDTEAPQEADEEPKSIPLPPPATEAPSEAPPAADQEVRASPVARKIAEERGIDLAKLAGTGPGGRITRDDVLAYEPDAEEEEPEPVAEPVAEAPEAAPDTAEPAESLSAEALSAEAPSEAEPTAAPAAAQPAAGEKLPLTKMRQQIARVTVRSKQEIPHFYVSAEIDMTQAMELRKQVNLGLESRGVRVSVNDMIIKACVGALKKYPKFNASFADDSIQMSETINVGIAIAEEAGLIVPAIMDCGDKSLADIASASKDLIGRSKSGTLHPQEYTGGTFSISNLGMFDVSSFAAIIQPPQSAVLAVGTVAKKPVVRGDEVAVAQMMTATVSVDHRVSDGAEGARFLVEVKRLLENPVSLLNVL